MLVVVTNRVNKNGPEYISKMKTEKIKLSTGNGAGIIANVRFVEFKVFFIFAACPKKLFSINSTFWSYTRLIL